MPTVATFVVMQVRQAPQQALSAGVMSALLLRSGRARVWARSSISLSVGPLRARRPKVTMSRGAPWRPHSTSGTGSYVESPVLPTNCSVSSRRRRSHKLSAHLALSAATPRYARRTPATSTVPPDLLERERPAEAGPSSFLRCCKPYPFLASAGSRLAAFGVPRPVTASQPLTASKPAPPISDTSLLPVVMSCRSAAACGGAWPRW